MRCSYPNRRSLLSGLSVLSGFSILHLSGFCWAKGAAAQGDCNAALDPTRRLTELERLAAQAEDAFDRFSDAELLLQDETAPWPEALRERPRDHFLVGAPSRRDADGVGWYTSAEAQCLLQEPRTRNAPAGYDDAGGCVIAAVPFPGAQRRADEIAAAWAMREASAQQLRQELEVDELAAVSDLAARQLWAAYQEIAHAPVLTLADLHLKARAASIMAGGLEWTESAEGSAFARVCRDVLALSEAHTA